MPHDDRYTGSIDITLFPRVRGLFPRVLGGDPFPRVGVTADADDLEEAMLAAGFQEEDIDRLFTELDKVIENDSGDDSTFG